MEAEIVPSVVELETFKVRFDCDDDTDSMERAHMTLQLSDLSNNDVVEAQEDTEQSSFSDNGYNEPQQEDSEEEADAEEESAYARYARLQLPNLLSQTILCSMLINDSQKYQRFREYSHLLIEISPSIDEEAVQQKIDLFWDVMRERKSFENLHLHHCTADSVISDIFSKKYEEQSDDYQISGQSYINQTCTILTNLHLLPRHTLTKVIRSMRNHSYRAGKKQVHIPVNHLFIVFRHTNTILPTNISDHFLQEYVLGCEPIKDYEFFQGLAEYRTKREKRLVAVARDSFNDPHSPNFHELEHRCLSSENIFLTHTNLVGNIAMPSRFSTFDRDVYVHPNIRQFIRDILVALQYHPRVWMGPLLHVEELIKIVSQVQAVNWGMRFVRPYDVRNVVIQVLAHRLNLRERQHRKFRCKTPSATYSEERREIVSELTNYLLAPK